MQSSLALCLLVAGGALLAGCGGPTVFAGKSQMTIAGTPPPPPPPAPPARVEVKEDRIEIKEKIQFDLNKAVIKEVSFGLLDEVAKVIREHPEIKRIAIEGHASSEGGDDYNLDLSDRRSKAVMEYLVSKGGIQADRLSAKGFGETKPISTNETEVGREANRRVEFNIVERDSGATKAAPATPASTTPAAPTTPTTK
jgi:outer membrane protein OmpA-like peptidoglycan-associated protein